MISVITCSVDDRRFSAVEAMYRAAMANDPFEIIRIPDAHSMSEGYNRGVSQCRGDVLIFSHDDIEILSSDFARRLTGHLDRYDVVGIAGTMKLAGPTWGWVGPPYIYGQLVQWSQRDNAGLVTIYSAPARHIGKMQALDGIFLATRRSVVQKVPFDAAAFTGFHHYDLDFTFRAHLAGMKLGVCCDLDLLHHSEGKFGGPAWEKSAEAFLAKHKSNISPTPQTTWQRIAVRVATRNEAKERLCPPHWNV